VQDFIEAYRLLRRFALKITVHVILGLPGENREDVLETARTVASLHPDGIKIHNLHIPYGTEMYEEYLRGELTVPSSRRHLEYTIGFLEHLPPQTIIMRLTCDTPAPRLAVPRRFWEKSFFFETVNQEMKRQGTYQGKLYSVQVSC
jgi:radical SAM superfamily enzyme